MKTAELTGAELDWAVTVALGKPVYTRHTFIKARAAFIEKHDGYVNPPGRVERHLQTQTDDPIIADLETGATRTLPNYSSDWAQGGPIIDLERISIRTYAAPGHNWVAFIDCGGSSISGAKARQVGSTALVAAMRCFVASKTGDTVELPKELA